MYAEIKEMNYTVKDILRAKCTFMHPSQILSTLEALVE
jgi:hypothetical protein